MPIVAITTLIGYYDYHLMTNIGYSDYFPNSQFQMHCLACLGKILPNDNYCLVTIFWPCPEVVIISDMQCSLLLHLSTFSLYPAM